MNMFARFDENPAMTLRVIKETKRYGRTDARTDGQRENSIPLQTKFAGGIIRGYCNGFEISFTTFLCPNLHRAMTRKNE